MKKEELYFDSRDGKSKIHAVRYLPEQKPVCIVQIIHGMAEYGERYEELAQFLADRGCVVTADDHLGHGKSVKDGEPYGYFCEQDPATVVVRDVHRLKKMTQQEYPGIPYVILGHSMGSFILRNYLYRYGSGIAAAIIMGTGSQPAALLKAGKAVAAVQKLFLGPRHVSNLLNKMAFGSYNSKIENPSGYFDWLSAEVTNVERYTADELCGFTFTVNGFQTLFELIDRCQRKENLEKIPKELPLFLVAGEDDPVGAYGAGVRKACDAFREAGMQNVTLKLFAGDRHEILNEKDKLAVMQELWQWIEQTVL